MGTKWARSSRKLVSVGNVSRGAGESRGAPYDLRESGVLVSLDEPIGFHPLKGPLLKVGRAKEHFDVLRRESEAFMAGEPYDWRTEYEDLVGGPKLRRLPQRMDTHDTGSRIDLRHLLDRDEDKPAPEASETVHQLDRARSMHRSTIVRAVSALIAWGPASAGVRTNLDQSHSLVRRPRLSDALIPQTS
jgi:hypothetical protein